MYIKTVIIKCNCNSSVYEQIFPNIYYMAYVKIKWQWRREKREGREGLTEICSDSREEVRELFDLDLQMGNCRFVSYYFHLFFCRICDEWIFVWGVTF